jgi:anti-anti-sigma factor
LNAGALVTSANQKQATMKFEVEDKGSYRILRCSGALGSIRDLSGEMVHPLIEDGRSRILVDLSGVDRITTEAISVFVTLVSRANAKGSRVVFVNPSPFVRAVFSATKITTFLETEDTMEKGLERLLADPE